MTDPRDIIAKSPMTAMQVAIVGITIALNALDGFDVLSISFASPGIMAEWKITRVALGFVLSMELIGMAFGSIFLGSLADKIGRRPTVLGCLVVMATGMFMATTSTGILGGLVTPVFALIGTTWTRVSPTSPCGASSLAWASAACSPRSMPSSPSSRIRSAGT